MAKCKECENKEIETCEDCGKPIFPKERWQFPKKEDIDNHHFCNGCSKCRINCNKK